MKKVLLAGIAAIFCMICLSGCESADEKKSGTFDIVCTVFPQYDWVKSITDGAENVNVTLLCDNGTDIHSYQPSAEDIMLIGTSDVLIGIGETDSWVFDTVYGQSGPVAVNLTELLGDRVLASENSDGHMHDGSFEHRHEQKTADEHIWLSLKNAEILTKRISEILSEENSVNSDVYANNTERYVKQLNDLDKLFDQTCKNASAKAIVFADRYPFRYLFDDYGIQCFAAFPGCSADTDASFETVISLADKLDEYSLSYVAVTENTDGKTAQAVTENSSAKNQQIIVLDSMQSITENDIKSGVTYISVMQKNLEAVKTLLG